MAKAIHIDQMVAAEDTVGTGPCGPSDPPGAGCDTLKVRIDMIVVAEDPWYHEVTNYLVNGRAGVVFTADPEDPGLLVIREIRDRTNDPTYRPAAAANESTTWGALIALFR
jgi:hypothetical protein